MNSLGFTGSRLGMTKTQQQKFIDWITSNPFDYFHHGDCVGADEQAHNLIREILPEVKIVSHPPVNETRRAFCKADVEYAPLPYLKRDRRIVEHINHLIATPATYSRVPRSGTWYTIDYATKLKVPVTILRNYNGET